MRKNVTVGVNFLVKYANSQLLQGFRVKFGAEIINNRKEFHSNV